MGKVSQKKSKPRREKTYPNGTKRITVLKTVRKELLKDKSQSLKNNGDISEVTMGIKLNPINLKAHIPIFMTSSSLVKTLNIGPAINSKHKVPKSISAIPKRIDSLTVFRHRSS